MNRREVLIGGACVAAAVAVPALLNARKAGAETFEVAHSEDRYLPREGHLYQGPHARGF